MRRLAGGVAHDLNNLLLTIILMSERALERAPAGAGSRAELERIRQAADRAAELARRLFAVAGRQALHPRAIDLNEVVTAAEPRLRALLGDAVELRLALDEGSPRAFFDREQLEQILASLAQSARDAMPEGGRLEIETAQATVHEPERDLHGTLSPGRYGTLAVSDTGPELDAATRAHVFEPYFGDGGGRAGGLALAIAHGIVGQGGGHIRIRSEPGPGLRFELFLPAAGSPGTREE